MAAPKPKLKMKYDGNPSIVKHQGLLLNDRQVESVRLSGEFSGQFSTAPRRRIESVRLVDGSEISADAIVDAAMNGVRREAMLEWLVVIQGQSGEYRWPEKLGFKDTVWDAEWDAVQKSRSEGSTSSVRAWMSRY